MYFRGKAFATVAFLAFSTSAWAADPVVYEPPPAPPQVTVSVYDWTGPYIGVQGGYGWADLEDDPDVDLFLGPESLDLDGGFIGGYAGYNVQWDQFVLGIEGDINKSWIDEAFLRGSAEIDWFGSLRGRAGFAWDRTLLFATAGVAMADVEIAYATAPSDSDSDTLTGWTAGLGVEHAFRDNWLARAEYRYYDFGGGDFTFVQFPAGSADLTMHTVSVGLAYKF